MRIGVIGIGRMGRAIIERYSSQDYVIYGWNRTKTKAKELKVKNFKILDHPAEVCREANIIFITLSDIEAIKNVFYQEKGLLQGLTSENIVLNISTITPEAALEFYKEVKKTGAEYVDMPVLGSPKKILKGELPILFSGNREVLERLKPILEILGKKIIYVGEIGKASALKLIFNMVLPVTVVVISEALNLGAKAGIEDKIILDALMDSPLSAAIKRYYDRMVHPNPPVSFTMKLMLKDLEYLTRMSYKLNTPLFLAPVVKELLKSAVANGFSEKYYAKIHDYLKKLSGLK